MRRCCYEFSVVLYQTQILSISQTVHDLALNPFFFETIFYFLIPIKDGALQIMEPHVSRALPSHVTAEVCPTWGQKKFSTTNIQV